MQCPAPFEQYRLTDQGCITLIDRNNRLGLVRTFNNSKSGYTTVKLFNNNIKRYQLVYIHRLMYLTFMRDTMIDGFDIDHRNHNRSDNRLENLRVLTRSENLKSRRPFKQSIWLPRRLEAERKRFFFQLANIKLDIV